VQVRGRLVQAMRGLRRVQRELAEHPGRGGGVHGGQAAVVALRHGIEHRYHLVAADLSHHDPISD